MDKITKTFQAIKDIPEFIQKEDRLWLIALLSLLVVSVPLFIFATFLVENREKLPIYSFIALLSLPLTSILICLIILKVKKVIKIEGDEFKEPKFEAYHGGAKVGLGISIIGTFIVISLPFLIPSYGNDIATSFLGTPTPSLTPIATSTPSPSNTITATTPPTLTATTEDPSATPVSTNLATPTAFDIEIAYSTQISSKDDMVQVLIPAGEFSIGRSSEDPAAAPDEMPQREVYVDDYWFDQTEVTNTMFARFIKETGYKTYAERWGASWVFTSQSSEDDLEPWKFVSGANWRDPLGEGLDIDDLDNHPVVHVTWFDAAAYCEWAGRRLPTEAEWEKAARSDARLYPWGNEISTGSFLNYADQNLDVFWADMTADDGYQFTAPVGSYPQGASPYGILDATGNVWEWVGDFYTVNDSDGYPRVIKGGAWRETGDTNRATRHFGVPPDTSNNTHGFRCAQSISPGSEIIPFTSNKPGNEDIFIVSPDGSGLVRLTTHFASDTGAAWSPDGSKIAFASNRDGDIYRIYLMEDSGENQTLLLSDMQGSAPSWSPDGNWIVFCSDTKGDYDIYKVRMDGTELIQLTFHEAADVDPVWSPDGSQILFRSERDGEYSDLYIMDADIGEENIQRLTENDAYEGYAVWSPDGSQILFTSELYGGRDIFLMNIEDLEPQWVANVDYDNNPSFAPDGRRIAFDSSINNRQILLSIVGGEPTQIQTGLVSAWLPAWSPVPGDERIAFTGMYDGDWEIYTWREDRNYALRLTDNISNEIQPRISPDGQWIVFASNRDGMDFGYRICVTTANYPDEDWKCLTEPDFDSRYPAWSPDGNQIVFSSNRDGNWDIYSIDQEGGNLEKLVDHPDDDIKPTWSSDGKIYFYSNRSGAGDIYKMDSDGKNLVPVITSPWYDTTPSLSPDGLSLAYAAADSTNTYFTDIYIMDLNSGNTELFFSVAGTSSYNPIWSRDGESIFFRSTIFWGIKDIYRLHLDSDDPINLTQDWREDFLGGP